jgi:replicative DNA helicase
LKQLEPTTGLLFSLAVIENKGPLSFLSAFRLVREFFTREEQRILDVMSKHVELYKEIPTKSLVEVETGFTLPILPVENNVQFWADEVRKRYAVENSHSLCKEAMAKISDGDIDSAADIATRLTRILIEGQTKTKVYSLEDTVDNILDMSKKARLNIRDFGVPFGLSFLDDRAGGAQGGDLITIAGLPGSSKTFLLMHMALTAHAKGSNILFIPTEMSEVQYHRRAIALRNNLNINRIKFGGLSTLIGEEVIKYDKQLLTDMPNKFYMTDSSMSLGILEIKSSAYVYKPDAIYIDGAYLLKPEFYAKSRYEIVSSVAESLKTLAKELNIPIFATYQLNKRTEDIYQSAVVRQLSSIVIELSDYDEDTGQSWGNSQKAKLLNITKGRDGEEGSTIIILDTEYTRIIQASDTERDSNSDTGYIHLDPVE